MDDKSFTTRLRKSWVRTAMIIAVTALIVAPLTAIASHRFTDVPDTNTFHGDIAWLKDADVTRGCNPPANTEFCPKDFVTREQMAAFMRRLAQNKVVHAATAETAGHATTASDADTVDGAHAADLRTTLDGLLSFGGQGGIPDIDLPAGESVVVLEKTLSPSQGDFAFVSYGYTGWDISATETRLAAWLQINNSSCSSFQTEPGTQVFDSHPANELSSLAGSAVIPVSGNTKITLCALAVNSAASVLNAHLNSIQTDTGHVTVTAATTGQVGAAAAEGD